MIQKSLFFTGVAALALTGFAPSSDAHHRNVKVKAPYTSVEVDKGVSVAAPYTRVRTGKRIRVEAPYTRVGVDRRERRIRIRAPYVNLNIGY